MQSNKTQIRETVIERLQAVGLRCPVNPQARPVEYGVLVGEYIDAIYERRIDPLALQARMTDFVRSWKLGRWPAIGELLDAIGTAPEHYAVQPTARPKEEDWAEDVMAMPEGQRALREGWGRELYFWAKDNPGKIPGAAVCEDCQRSEAAFRASFRNQIDEAKKMDRDQANPMKSLMRAAVLKAGAAMDGFENKLKKEFLESGPESRRLAR